MKTMLNHRNIDISEVQQLLLKEKLNSMKDNKDNSMLKDKKERKLSRLKKDKLYNKLRLRHKLKLL